MKYSIIKVRVDQVGQHPFHQEMNDTDSSDFLEESLKRTGNKPVYPPVVVPSNDQQVPYMCVGGMKRLESMIQLGQTEAEVILYDISDEKEIKDLIVDLNIHHPKTGLEKMKEFIHFDKKYPPKKGVPGNRYSMIAKELGRSKDWVKDMVILIDFFKGEGDCILEKIFGGELSVAQSFQIKKVVEKYPEKFTSEKSFEKICDPSFDFSRLGYGLTYLSLDDDLDFDLLKSYLSKDINFIEFNEKLKQMGKVEKRIDSHEKNKVFIPIVDDVYTTENSHLIRGNNHEVEFKHPFKREIQCLIGSPPYGNRRLNGDDPETDTGHNMSGQEYGLYLAETYEKYKPFMSKDGSIYVIIDDYRLNNGAHACSLEHFVIEMAKKGFFLVGRYTWVKDNPMPRSYTDKDMVNGFEMIYRFSLDPKIYYSNPDLFIELEKGQNEGFKKGCVNTDGKGNTSRGSSFYQSHLKKLRNTLNQKTCSDIIKGNVANPRDFFIQADEKIHTSQSPMYLTSTLILESTKSGDLVVDIWNGVGNTMDSALLLGRQYVGVELKNDYFQQSCRRADDTENIMRIISHDDLSKAA